jgi:hypothetical protein
MKNLRIWWAAVLTVVVLMYVLGWTYSYNVTTPADSESPTLGAQRIREGKLAMQERLDRDMYFPVISSEVSSEYAGLHRWLTFYCPNTAPSSLPAGQGRLQIQTVGTNPELFFYDQNEQGTQITSNARVNLGDASIANNNWLVSINAAGTGTANLIKADVNDKAVLPDGALTLTSAAPTVDTGIANKKYVDDAIVASAYSGYGAWDTNTTGVTYTAGADGTVHCYTNGPNAEHSLQGETPVGTIRVKQVTGAVYATNPVLGFSMDVRKGDTWKITVTNATATVYWLPK